MGRKTQLFTPRMQPYYDYTLSDTLFQRSQPAYVFSARVKPKYLRSAYQNRTVIKDYNVIVRKDDFQFLQKSYHLDYNSGLYHLVVQLDIELNSSKKTGDYFPSKIHYSGEWKLPFRKKERAQFYIYSREP